jgi:hypothetical protein
VVRLTTSGFYLSMTTDFSASLRLVSRVGTAEETITVE